MLRTTLGALIGAVLTVVLVVAGTAVAFIVLSDSFYEAKDDVLHASPTACGVVMGVGLIAALVGGFVGTLIGRTWMPVTVLVLLTVVFGGLVAARGLKTEPKELGGKTAADISFDEMDQYVAQPMWYLIGNPVAGVIGLLIGGAAAPKRRVDDA
jgi:small-conductance mechanosensitive channel